MFSVPGISIIELSPTILVEIKFKDHRTPTLPTSPKFRLTWNKKVVSPHTPLTPTFMFSLTTLTAFLPWEAEARIFVLIIGVGGAIVALYHRWRSSKSIHSVRAWLALIKNQILPLLERFAMDSRFPQAARDQVSDLRREIYK